METTAPTSTHFTASAGPLTHDVSQLHGRIAELLARAGVSLPDARLSAIAETVLADAVQISLQWLERGAEAAGA